MKLRQGNMFADLHGCDILCFTANSTLTRDGRLVMGVGAASSVREGWPGSDLSFGRILAQRDMLTRDPYGVLLNLKWTKPTLAAFQTKEDWRKPSTVRLIENAVEKLSLLANSDWAGKRVWLNFPGMGYGGLRREAVLPVIRALPDNVVVWEFADKRV